MEFISRQPPLPRYPFRRKVDGPLGLVWALYACCTLVSHPNAGILSLLPIRGTFRMRRSHFIEFRLIFARMTLHKRVFTRVGK